MIVMSLLLDRITKTVRTSVFFSLPGSVSHIEQAERFPPFRRDQSLCAAPFRFIVEAFLYQNFTQLYDRKIRISSSFSSS